MSIESEQRKWMEKHYYWREKVIEIENKIADANAEGRNGRKIYEYELSEARNQVRLCLELATDRGF